MKKLFLPIITSILATYLVACGGGGSTTTKGDINTDENSVHIEKVLKSDAYIKLYVEFDIFALSHDGTKAYGISDHTFFVTDITSIYPWMKSAEEEIYHYKDISKLEIDLPSDTSGDLSKPNQSLSAIVISPDGQRAYLTTYDSRHNGGMGTLVSVDISDPKQPKVIDKDSINLYFDGITIFPNGKYLLAMTSKDGSLSTDLTVIDIQNLTNPNVAGSIQKSSASDDVINAISISDDSKRAYIATDNTIEIINLEDPTLPRRIHSIKGDALAIAATKNRKRVYANSEKKLNLYDVEKDKMRLIDTYEIPGDGNYDEIENLILSDDENSLYVTCSDMNETPNNSLLIFDTSEKDALNFKKKVPAPANSVLTYDHHNYIAPDGKKFYALAVWLYIINLQ